jgi:AcrR family transcriptional regulator
VLNSTRTRTGRRRGSTGTREAILRAARSAFARTGYGGASLRGVAAKAGVDPGLVLHFFGDKAGLFAASLQLPFEPSELEAVLEGDTSKLGRRIATFYLKRIFRDGAQTVQSLLRSAVSHPAAAAILKATIETNVVKVLERRFPGPETALRGELVASHMMGLFFARRILGVAPIASIPDEELIELVAPALQHYLEPVVKRRRR